MEKRNTENIKQLQKEFISKGNKYIQLLKTDKVVVYKVYPGLGTPYFEVFDYKIRQNPPHWNTEYDSHEVYPSDEDFGKWAKCFTKFNTAKKRIKELYGEDVEDFTV